MKQLKVTLQLWFENAEIEEMMLAEDLEDVEKKQTAFALMEEDGEFNWIEHLKKFNPKDFVGFEDMSLGDLGEVKSAKWLPEGKIEYIVEFDETCEFCEDKTDEGIIRHAIDQLLDSSLEDAEYESCQDNGWVIMTKPLEDGTQFEYGLTDYRNRKNIHVEIV
jgi:hypothetical protein